MIWEIDENRKVIAGLDEDGKPDPEYAAALGLRNAPYGRRAGASAIEWAVYIVLYLPYLLLTLPKLVLLMTGALTAYGFFNHPDLLWTILGGAISIVLVLAFSIVQIVLHGKKGVTLGKACMGLRAVNVKTLEAPGIGRMFLRAGVFYLTLFVPILPIVVVLTPLWDKQRRGRGWLDAVGDSWLVDARKGLDPYHVKKMRIARKTLAADPVQSRVALPSLATPVDQQRQGGYMPGARTSSGVIGAAKPYAPGTASDVGLPQTRERSILDNTTTSQPPAATREDRPYRPGQLSGSAPAAPISQSPPWHAAAQPTVPPPAAQQYAQPAPGLPPAAEPARQSETVEDLEATRVSARSRTQPSLGTVVFDTGDRFVITGAALIGRNPQAADGEEIAHLLPLVDETRSISKTHLLVIPREQGMLVVDRHSTNGVGVARAGAAVAVQPGVATPVAFGETVHFGDRWLRVEAP